MKRLSLLSVLVCLVSVRASSQGAIYQTVDYPIIPADEGYVTLPANMFMVAGSAFDCETGDHPPALMISAHRLTIGAPQIYMPQTIYLTSHLYRPDIRARYAESCPAVTDYTGYAARIAPDLPPGYWQVYVAWASVPFGQQVSSFIVEIQ